ncbi:amino acid ABC transporter permease [Helicobacter saguini]|uniref:ABC transporter permease subunit n=1 Tax=Helicobacter saguini TaxID=1548018 RepID=A0A6L7D9H3_9HELI|nr:amino acid ABC transporter permease [Helicobacter saguini]MWV69811.1 ABC transporter permease subunit [Helicobacter saguini]
MQNIFKLLVFFLIVGLGLYFTFPYEISKGDLDATFKSIGTTFILTIGGVSIGIVVGFALAFLRLLNIKILTFIIDEYIDIMRGTPIMIQLFIFAYVVFATLSDNFLAALVALGLNSSAYIAEIIRAGINSVDKGQLEAARAMGLNFRTSMQEVVFPQAIKNILPSLANEFIVLFKETSVVGLISVNDLTLQSKSLQALLYNPTPIIFAVVIYYACVKVFSWLAQLLEWELKKHD